MGNVSEWVEMGTALGSAVVGGLVGGGFAVAAPLMADRRVANREQARITRERDTALRLVVEEVTSNLGTVRLLGLPSLASQAGEISDATYQASKNTIAQYLGPEEFVNLDELYAQFKKVQGDRATGRDISGSLRILTSNGPIRVAAIREVMKTKVRVSG